MKVRALKYLEKASLNHGKLNILFPMQMCGKVAVTIFSGIYLV